jgi:integrase
MPDKTSDLYKRHKTRYRGISYRVRADGSRSYFVYSDGKQIQVEGGEAEAVALQAKLRAAAKNPHRNPSTVSVAILAEEWIHSKRVRPRTIDDYRAYLNREILPIFGSKKVSAITPQDVAKLIRDLEERGLASSTINSYLLPLSGTLDMAVSRGLIPANPCKLLTRDERPRKKVTRRQDHIWNDEEIQALLEASEYLARQPEARYNYAPLLRVSIKTGLRPGELLGLQWQDIDFDRKELRVERQWTRKGELAPPKTEAALRRLPLSDDLVSFLREHHKRDMTSGRASEFVFPSRAGGPLSHRNVVRRGFEPAAKLAQIEGVSFYSLRHAFASRMIFRGVSSHVLAHLMGHESSTITERRYIHLFDAVRTDDLVRQAMSS